MDLARWPIEPRMVVMGADARLVGEVARVWVDSITVSRTPLASITLPLNLVASIDGGVVVLDVSADHADSVGEGNRPELLLT